MIYHGISPQDMPFFHFAEGRKLTLQLDANANDISEKMHLMIFNRRILKENNKEREIKKTNGGFILL